MEFECGKVELGTSMKHATAPIWNVQLEWPLRLRWSASVDAHASLKHFTTAIRWLVARMTDAETSWRGFASFQTNPKNPWEAKETVLLPLYGFLN
jgi:hypothetical protein